MSFAARCLSLGIVLTGCGFGGATGVDGSPVDAVLDVDASSEPVDGAEEPDAAVPPDARACFGTVVSVCLTTLPADGVIISATEVVDTDSSARCIETNQPGVCVIAGTFVTVTGAGTRVRARGSKPLVLLATQGEVGVDAGAAVEAYSSNFSDSTGVVGPGANPSACPLAGLDGTNVGTSGGGGAGGSFGGRGGDGGDGDVNGGAQGGQGGTAAMPALSVTALRGGCPGGAGGRPNGATSSKGGDGGGAVALIASTRVRVDGRIDASGGGGFASLPASDGGGGGGAGGMIYIEGSTGAVIGAAAAIYANGGAGAGGAGSGSSQGARGGESSGPAVEAQGGSGGGSGARGGNGAFGAGTGQTPATASGNDGGGGGGGGTGVIVLIPAVATDLIHVSPPPR